MVAGEGGGGRRLLSHQQDKGEEEGDNLTVPRGGWNEKSESGERNSSEMMQMCGFRPCEHTVLGEKKGRK